MRQRQVPASPRTIITIALAKKADLDIDDKDGDLMDEIAEVLNHRPGLEIDPKGRPTAPTLSGQPR